MKWVGPQSFARECHWPLTLPVRSCRCTWSVCLLCDAGGERWRMSMCFTLESMISGVEWWLMANGSDNALNGEGRLEWSDLWIIGLWIVLLHCRSCNTCILGCFDDTLDWSDRTKDLMLLSLLFPNDIVLTAIWLQFHDYLKCDCS